MSRDQLYLLKPDFFDNGKRPYFCPGCAQMVGLLVFYPALKQRLSAVEDRQVILEILRETKPTLPGYWRR